MRIGTRVKLHPVLDIWMRGQRYGTVLSTWTGRANGALPKARLRLDNGRIVIVLISDITEVD